MGLLVCFLVNEAVGLFIKTKDERSRCFTIQLKSGDGLGIVYVVSGEQEANNMFFIIDPKQEVSFEMSSMHEYSGVIVANQTGAHQICFKSFDDDPKLFSFEFYTELPHGHNLVQAEHVDQAAKDINDALKIMERVVSHQQFQSVRELSHSNLLVERERRVKLCLAAKVILLVLMAIIQLYVLTGFLNKRVPNPV
eukprot:TRINITY_DN7419_c0_g1_i6.p1 TRINITY_DN7419_c0_g1~~TRINITY_DN7419_c0_g1_i6.p1  ORF type:complete len:195 (+),score=36.89 TRINITY_DN7419_c0_g1_i6:95-679(+)